MKVKFKILILLGLVCLLIVTVVVPVLPAPQPDLPFYDMSDPMMKIPEGAWWLPTGSKQAANSAQATLEGYHGDWKIVAIPQKFWVRVNMYNKGQHLWYAVATVPTSLLKFGKNYYEVSASVNNGIANLTIVQTQTPKCSFKTLPEGTTLFGATNHGSEKPQYTFTGEKMTTPKGEKYCISNLAVKVDGQVFRQAYKAGDRAFDGHHGYQSLIWVIE